MRISESTLRNKIRKIIIENAYDLLSEDNETSNGAGVRNSAAMTVGGVAARAMGAYQKIAAKQAEDFKFDEKGFVYDTSSGSDTFVGNVNDMKPGDALGSRGFSLQAAERDSRSKVSAVTIKGPDGKSYSVPRAQKSPTM